MFRKKLKIIDAHTHFFSYQWFEFFLNLARDQFAENEGVEALAARLGWEPPPRQPEELGRRWVAEQEKYGLTAQVLFASKLNDAEQLAVAVQACPQRLIGYVLVDPTQPSVREQVHYSLHILGMKGILMFPAMHHFHAHEQNVYPVYEEAAAAQVPVFLHFGLFNLPIYDKLGIPSPVDLSYSNPRDLREPAQEFSDVNFIVPHFGCGRFEEALEVAAACPNVYFDTSSSNAWIEPPLTLTEVFRRSLEVLGPRRLLFGTDSSFFPRGWRKEIFDRQKAILDELGVSDSDQALIFGGNVARILAI